MTRAQTLRARLLGAKPGGLRAQALAVQLRGVKPGVLLKGSSANLANPGNFYTQVVALRL